jgi:thermitase
MPGFKQLYRQVLIFFFVLALSLPGLSQEGTEEPTLPPATEATPVELIDPTQETTPVEVIDPTQEVAPTEEITPSEAPVIEPTTEAPLLEATDEVTLEAPIPTAAPQSTDTPAPRGNEVEMLLRYNIAASEASIQEMLRSLGAVELERIPQLGVMRVLIPSSVSNTTSARNTLQASSLASTTTLTSLEPNIVWQLDFTPNDPIFLAGDQPDLKDSDGSNFSIFMESAWQISPRDGQGVTVAVIDSGVDLQHPEFIGKLVPGWDFYNDDNNPDDDEGHGTHVAGVIAAKTNNGIGMAGIAFNSMILPLKVCGWRYPVNLPPEFICPIYEIAAGIIYAVDRGAKVINLSLGGTAISTTVQGAVNYALSRNVVVVAAAGNNGDNDNDGIVEGNNLPYYPASYIGVISVGAVNEDATIANFSNTSSNVTVVAPGVDIVSTIPREDGSYGYNTGTSMASPHVAGLAALLIADGVATTPATVREALICSSENDLNPSSYDNVYGYGLIQADLALTWNGNSSSCQVTLANDLIQNAMTITTPPFSIIQPLNTRSVTESASDPKIGLVQPNQTLWYKFTPTTSGQFDFSTLGSAYVNTMLAVYEGQPGALREIASNDDLEFALAHSHLAVSLTKGISYYVLAGINDFDLSNQFIQLNVNPALTVNTLQQENAPFIRYTGTWNRVAVTGANGGFINTTTDGEATVSFLVRGTSLKYTRMVGPTQGAVQILVDGNAIGLFDNNAAVTRSETYPYNIPLGTTTGQWHLVMFRSGGSSRTPFSIDAIQVLDGTLPTGIVGATRANDASLTLFQYLGTSWFTGSQINFFNGDVRKTGHAGDYVEFRTNGSSITIFRDTGSNNFDTGVMEIYLDNVLAATVDNGAFSDAYSIPYSIANLNPRERVVRVVNVSGDLEFDGAQSITQMVLPAGPIVDERSTSIIYTGLWAKASVATTVANAGTLSNISGTSGGGKAEFMFNGNHLCIGYQEGAGNRSTNVIIDGTPADTIDSSGGLNKIEWCTYNNGINRLTDGLHSVTLEIPANNNFNLDYIRPVRRTVFTSSMGYISETNPSIFYTGIWATTTQRSTGGATFQGASARRADVNTVDLETVSFTMNGTGFIIYTSISPNGGGYEVYVDGVLEIPTYQGVINPDGVLFLWDYRNLRFRPVGLGLVDFDQEIHHIQLRAVNPDTYGDFVDFDGIRVIP